MKNRFILKRLIVMILMISMILPQNVMATENGATLSGPQIDLDTKDDEETVSGPQIDLDKEDDEETVSGPQIDNEVEAVNPYTGIIYVSNSPVANDTNDGRTPDTPVATLDMAQQRLIECDMENAAKAEVDSSVERYLYPKIMVNHDFTSQGFSGVQSLDFSYFKCDSQVSETGYRASLWRDDASEDGRGLFVVGRDGILTFGEGVILNPICEKALIVVEKGGVLNLNHATIGGGVIENYGTLNLDVTGNAVTAGIDGEHHSIITNDDAEGITILQHGTMNMSSYSVVEGVIRLGGKGVTDEEDRNINIINDANGTGLSCPLNFIVDNMMEGRCIATYSALNQSIDLQGEKALYQVAELEKTRLFLTHEGVSGEVHIKLVQPGIYYVDGENGKDDDRSYDGKTPEKAFASLKRAYQALQADYKNPDLQNKGGVVYIVEETELSSMEITYGTEGSVLTYQNGAESVTYTTGGEVVIRRYSQPTVHESLAGYQVESYTGTMFEIPEGEHVTIQGVTIDGHSKAVGSDDEKLAAPEVKDTKQFFEVDGTLELRDTLLQNNDSADVVHVLGNGHLILNKGAEGYPQFDGEIYLGGDGSSSGHLTIMNASSDQDIEKEQYTLRVQDPYHKRLLVEYLDSSGVPGWLDENDVKDYIVLDCTGYSVEVDEKATNHLVLEAFPAVYINGQNGDDDAAGRTPAEAVKTLKRAYEVMAQIASPVLYVVDTVEVSEMVEINEDIIIQRYVQPTAYEDADLWSDLEYREGFSVGSNTHALFEVLDGAEMKLGNLILDGHGNAVNESHAGAYTTSAEGYTAEAPLVYVNAGGTLIIEEGAVLQNNKNAVSPDDLEAEVSAEKAPGGAVMNLGLVKVEGGSVMDNENFGNEAEYSVEEETVLVTTSASGIYQKGSLVFEAEELTWGNDQYIYLAEEPYEEALDEDTAVAYITLNAVLPEGTVLPIDMNRAGAVEDAQTGWFAPDRKVVQLLEEGLASPESFVANGGAYAGTYLKKHVAVSDELIMTERLNDPTILELQTKDRVCIIDAIVPLVKASGEEKTRRTGKGNVQLLSDEEEVEIIVEDQVVKLDCEDNKK